MIHLGITPAEETALYAALIDSHTIRTTVLVLDKDEKPVTALTGEKSKLVDGSVQIDSEGDITRSCSLTLFDPQQTLQFDSASPADGALFVGKFISVIYGVWVTSLGRYIDIPIFTGPLVGFERSGALVKVDALGKESLALAPHLVYKAFSVPKGTRLDAAIRKVMDSIGETKYLIPDISKRLPVDRAVLPENEPWNVITQESDGIVKRKVHGTKVWKDKQGHVVKKKKITTTKTSREPVPSILSYSKDPMFAFYNGRGQLVVRSTNTSSGFTFQEGTHLSEPPQISYDVSEFRNHVRVTGVASKGTRKNKSGNRVQYDIPAPVVDLTLPSGHPLAPINLGRGGKGRYFTELVDAPGLKKKAQVLAKAQKVLDGLSSEGLDVSFDSLPIPMLEEGDLVTVVYGGNVIDFRIGQITIPLTANSLMSVGVNKKITHVTPKKKGKR